MPVLLIFTSRDWAKAAVEIKTVAIKEMMLNFIINRLAQSLINSKKKDFNHV
jgi:hypothetical protein